jgi:hypothetical protein
MEGTSPAMTREVTEHEYCLHRSLRYSPILRELRVLSSFTVSNLFVCTSDDILPVKLALKAQFSQLNDTKIK